MKGALPRGAALALVVVLLGCGKKGDPLPPRRRTPAAVAALKVAQRGEEIEISLRAPATTTDGGALPPALDIEIAVALGDGDFERLAARRVRRARPGEAVTDAVPRPSPGTTVRVAARALAGRRASVRTPVTGLVAQAPPPAPTGLVAALDPSGADLTWQGTRPDPVTAALPALAGPALLLRSRPAASPAAPRPGGEPGTPSPTSAPPARPPSGPEEPPSTPAAPKAPSPAAPPAPGPVEAAGPPPFPGGFSIYRRLGDAPFTTPLVPPLDGNRFFDITAPLGQRACYVVRGVASLEPLVESAAPEEACVTVADIAPPAAPGGLNVLPVGAGLELAWSPSPEPDLAGYRIERATGGGEHEPLADVPPDRTQYVDTSAARGPVYRYRIVAVDAAGNTSPPSAEAEGSRP